MSNTSDNRPNDDAVNTGDTANAQGPGSRSVSAAPAAARFRTPIIVVTVSLIVVLLLIAVAGPIYTLVMGSGVKTEPLNADGAEAATTDINGTWHVVPGVIPNHSSAGFTFDEILPAERKTTSGSTIAVTGDLEVANDTLNSGLITVDMSNISTDQEKRDINVRAKLFHTDEFPTATFEVTEPVDLTAVPADGTVGEVVVPGELTIHGQSNDVAPTFAVLRDGDQVILSSDIEINRLDYNVETPEFIAAQVDEIGAINVRLTLEK